VSAPPARAQSSNNDAILLCQANDPEITGNLMVYQRKLDVQDVDEHLFVSRLVADPPLNDIRPETVFFGAPADLGGGLPPLGESHNGPEIGHDGLWGWEVVYTLANAPTPGFWNVVRAANDCSFWGDDETWAGCWDIRLFLNANPSSENRWFPFATTVWAQPANVVYFVDDDPPRDDAGRRLAFRTLEAAGPAPYGEYVIDDANATGFGQWERIDNEDFILTLYDDPQGNRQIALYDLTPFPIGTPPFQVITSGEDYSPGAALWLDPASGRYTLVALRLGDPPTSNVAEVWQRFPSGVWIKQYEFVAGDVGESAPTFVWLQSLEAFTYQNFSYLVFQTSTASSFLEDQDSNVRIVRVEQRLPLL
jgi:hypothetical protein